MKLVDSGILRSNIVPDTTPCRRLYFTLLHQPSTSTWEACSHIFTKPHPSPSPPRREASSLGPCNGVLPLGSCLWDLRNLTGGLGGWELPDRSPDSLQLQEEGTAFGAKSHRRRLANWPARSNDLGRRGTPRALPGYFHYGISPTTSPAMAQTATPREDGAAATRPFPGRGRLAWEDGDLARWAACATALILHFVLLVAAQIVTNMIRALARMSAVGRVYGETLWADAADFSAVRRCVRAIKVGRSRIRRRFRRKRKRHDRIRARCRRAEAWILAYLAVSSHLLHSRFHHRGWRQEEEATRWRTPPYAEDGPCCEWCANREAGSGGGYDQRAPRASQTVVLRAGADEREHNRSGGRWWSDARRVGEAANPGPTAATVAIHGILQKTYATARSAISYPSPGTRSLRGAIAPGHNTSDGDKDGEQLFALTIETANTTGWRGLQRRLATTTAHALLAQETWITQDAVPAASAWALRRGWKSVWTAATPGPNGGASGGTAIFVRSHLGLRYPPDGSHEWCQGRAVAGVIDAPGHRPMLLVSCYLVHGIGPAQANLDLLAAIGRRKQAMTGDYEMVVGGDMNMEPPDFATTGFDSQLNATLLIPSTCRGTFRAAKAASLLDYFVVTNRAAAAVQSVKVVEASGAKGHIPVMLTFKPCVTSLRALYLRRPPALGISRVYGPVVAPPCWTQAADKAESALGAAKRGDGDTQGRLDEAYRAWADLAEQEICDYTGEKLKKYGERGRMPNFVWRSVVPEETPPTGEPAAATAAWMGGVLKELTRCANAVAAHHDARGDDADDVICGPDLDHDGVADDMQIELEIRTARARRPPTSRRGCARVIREIVGSLESDYPGGRGSAMEGELEALHGKVLGSATNLHDAIIHDYDVAGSRSIDTRNAAIGEVQVVLAELTAEAAEIEARATAQASAEASRRWKEWVNEGVERGAARAHAYVRGPKAWTPTVARLPDGSESGALDDLIADQRAKYSRLWRPAQKPFHYLWDERDAMPRMTPEQMREAAGSFPEATATTFDGFHPRGLACLSDEALATLATLLEAVETSGIWPRQLSMVVAALLPKPAGGYRPIGLAPAVYRLWSKVRRADADAWERRHPRPYFSQCKGSGPIDAMWRLAARQEAGVAEGEVAATASEDIQSFFETLDRERLANEARALGFPLPVLRAALAAYSSARVVTMGGRISREVYPTTGVVAGCSLAMALTKVYCLRAFDDFVSEAPRGVRLGTFVDDLTLAAVGAPAAVVDDITRAHAILTDIINGTLGCTFAAGKTTLTATTRSVAAAIARRLHIPGGTSVAATLLGIDNTSAAPRAVLRGKSKKSTRLKAAMARRKRLKQVQQAIGTRARKIFVAGVQPAATYGAQLWGLDDGEVSRLRRVAAAALRPQGRGRSLQATLLWHDLPTAAAELAPLLQLARATWDAVTTREAAQERGASIADIRRWWQAASGQFGPLVKKYEQRAAEARQRGASIPLSATRSLWRSIKGPLGAAAMTAARIGWKFGDPFCLLDQNGTDFMLTNTSPALVRKLATEALRANLERNVAEKWAVDEHHFSGRRACFDFVTAGVKACKDLTPHQRGIMRAVACGALMTGSRAAKMGYLVSGLCPLCGEAPDTLTHRVYECACTAAAVSAVVPNWFMEEARRAAAGNRFWTTGVCPSPVDLAPLPAKDFQVVVERLVDDDGDADADDHGDLTAIRGRAYWDGSATTSVVRGLTRAACAIVQTNARGEPTKILQAAVPRHLPQTAQAAEFLGLGLVFQSLRGPTAVIGDCMNVVRAANGLTRDALGHRQMYAGITLSTYRQPEWRKWAGEVLWTRAHRKPTGHETEDELRDIRGNAAADAAAKGALEGHAAIGADAESQVLFYERRVPHVIRATIAALQLFPKAPGDMKRAPKPLTEEQARQKHRHHWAHRGGAWRCTLCDDWLNGEQVPRYRKFQRCRGRTIVDKAREFASKGHAIYQAEADVRFVYCGHCGAWGHKRTHLLSTACSPPRASGVQALRRISRGEHPMQRRGPQGILLPRERVRTMAKYDGVDAQWKRIGSEDQENASWTLDGRASAGSDHGSDARERHIVRDLSANDDVMRQVVEQASEHCNGADGDAPDPSIDHVMFDQADEDVFGHGGSLDQLPTPAAGPGYAQTPGNRAPGHPGGEVVQCSKRGVRSIWERSAEGSAAAAIERMKRGSRPPGTDATERLRAVKRRVLERLGGGDEAHRDSPLATANSMEEARAARTRGGGNDDSGSSGSRETAGAASGSHQRQGCQRHDCSVPAAGARCISSSESVEPYLDDASGCSQPRHRPRRGPVPNGCAKGNVCRMNLDVASTDEVGFPTPSGPIDPPPPSPAARAPVLRPQRRHAARQHGDGGDDGAARLAGTRNRGSPCADGPPGGPQHLDGGLARHRGGGADAAIEGGVGAADRGATRPSWHNAGGHHDLVHQELLGNDGESAAAAGGPRPAKRRRIRGKQAVPRPGAAERLLHEDDTGALPLNSSGAAAARAGPSRLSYDSDLVQRDVARQNRDGRALRALHGDSGSAWTAWRGRPPDAVD